MSSKENQPTYVSLSVTTAIACALAFYLGRISAMGFVSASPPQPTVALEPVKAVGSRPRALQVHLHPSQTQTHIESPEEKAARLEGLARHYQEDSQRRHWDETSAKQTEEYRTLFSTYGLSNDVLTNTLRRLRRLHELASSLNNASIALQEERIEYDTYMRDSMSTNIYNQYIGYEAGKPAKREVLAIRAHMQQSGLSLTDGDMAGLAHAIASSKSTTLETWHGPYDPLPHPNVGKQAVTDSVKDRRASLQQRVSELFDNMPAELDPTIRSEVSRYFDAKLSKLDRIVNNLGRADASKFPTRDQG